MVGGCITWCSGERCCARRGKRGVGARIKKGQVEGRVLERSAGRGRLTVAADSAEMQPMRGAQVAEQARSVAAGGGGRAPLRESRIIGEGPQWGPCARVRSDRRVERTPRGTRGAKPENIIRAVPNFCAPPRICHRHLLCTPAPQSARKRPSRTAANRPVRQRSRAWGMDDRARAQAVRLAR